jgi:hypothetical protein
MQPEFSSFAMDLAQAGEAEKRRAPRQERNPCGGGVIQRPGPGLEGQVVG